MVVTQTWQFPPFNTLITQSYMTSKLDIERHRILEAENNLRDNQGAQARRLDNSIYLSHQYLMIFDHTVLRAPPPAIIDELRQLDTLFKVVIPIDEMLLFVRGLVITPGKRCSLYEIAWCVITK
jgi:hypothetical protein